MISPHFRHADGFPEIPSALHHGYHVTEAGKQEPLWFDGDVIPMALVDVLEENGNGEEITLWQHQGQLMYGIPNISRPATAGINS